MASALYVLGGGGHGRAVLDALLSSGKVVTGICDSQLGLGELVFGVPVVGGNGHLEQIDPENIALVNGVGANPLVRDRRNLFELMVYRGFSFASIRHPSAIIGRECALGEGTQIMAGAVLQNRTMLAKNTVVNTHASVDHNCSIGAHSFVAPGAVLAGGVSIGESSFIGAGAVVLPGIRVGINVVVGAGAVVTRDVPDGWVIAGNPAARIGRHR